jgi:hypothetical protein
MAVDNPDDITSGASLWKANVEPATGDTADSATMQAKRVEDKLAETESSELTAAESASQVVRPRIRAGQLDELVSRFRASQASALFDPEAMSLLEKLQEKPLFTFEELAKLIETPEAWLKLAILVRAYFVEPLDNGVRATPEASEAIKKISNYLSRLDIPNYETETGKES